MIAQIRSTTGRRYARGGHVWSPEWTDIDLATLDRATRKILEADPHLEIRSPLARAGRTLDEAEGVIGRLTAALEATQRELEATRERLARSGTAAIEERLRAEFKAAEEARVAQHAAELEALTEAHGEEVATLLSQLSELEARLDEVETRVGKDSARPEPAKPETPKPDAAKTDAAKTDATKPEAAKSDGERRAKGKDTKPDPERVDKPPES